jgi:hypothetical protein
LKNKPYGKIIIPAHLFPEKHELETASFLAADIGKNVEFLTPAYSKGIRTPDIQMDGVLWEIKSPQGNSRRTIENNYRMAEKQSQNIIFDLRRMSMDEIKAIAAIKREFKFRHRTILRLLVITKNKKLLDMKR